MSKPLFLNLMKKNLPLWGVFTGILVFYLVVIVFTFGIPEVRDSFAIIGIEVGTDITLMDYTAMGFFGTVMFMFPPIFFIMLAYKLVYKPIDSNSLSSFLSTPISRKKYILTTGVLYLVAIFAMFLITWLLGIISVGLFPMAFPDVEIGSYSFIHYTNMVFTLFLATMAVASISFLFSCIGHGKKFGLALLIGLPIVFILIQMLGSMAGLDFLLHFTPLGWIDAMELNSGTASLWWLFSLIYIAITGTLFFLALKLFNKKQLSI